MRMATFDLSQVDTEDERAVERAWNDFVDALRFQGYRPADMAASWTDTSTTYRVFELDLEDEAETFTLDFDIAKLGRVATGVLALAGVVAGMMAAFLGDGVAVLA